MNALLLSLLFLGWFEQSSTACSKSLIGQPVVAALLDLHYGIDCSQVNIPAFQQLAVIETAVKQANEKHTPLRLGLQVFDTCSSERGAVGASMHALVASLQTCLKSPLFAGFIGPENEKFLKAIENFTGSFNFTHLLPYSLNVPSIGENRRILYLNEYPITQLAEAIHTVVSEVEMKAPMILYEDNHWSRTLLTALLNELDSDQEICKQRNVIAVENSTLFFEMIKSSVYDGVLMLVEEEETFTFLNKIIADSEFESKPLIIAPLHSALQDKFEWNKNCIFVNQIWESENFINERLNNVMSDFIRDGGHICAKHKLFGCEDRLMKKIVQSEYDWSLSNYEAIIQVISLGLKLAQSLKCNKSEIPCLTSTVISQGEWHRVLLSSQLKLGNVESQEASYTVRSAAHNTSHLKKVGKVIGDEVISETGLIKVESFTGCPNITLVNLVEVTTGASLLDIWFPSENAGLYQAAGLVTGAVTGLFLFFFIVSMCVYRSFKLETRSSSRSSFTMQTRGSISS